MKILQLPIHSSGVPYYRHHLPTLALRKKGHEVIALSDGSTNWVMDAVMKAGDHEKWLAQQLDKGVDIVHAGWSNNLEHVELLVAARNRNKIPIIIDYDDDVLNVDSSNVSYAKHYHEGAFSRRVARLGLRIADAVTLSTTQLAKSLHNQYKTCNVLDNYAYPEHWLSLSSDPARLQDKSIRVLLAGGPSHSADTAMASVQEGLEWAINYYDGKEGKPHVKLIFLACMPKWAARYITDTSSATVNKVFFVHPTGDDVGLWQRVIKWVSPDIFMAPLEHNKFNESKSLIKCYDAAMVEGCAFACEELSTYQDIPQNACVNVNSNGQGSPWQVALKELIEDRDMRRGMSKSLRKWVLDCRSIDDNIYKWEAAYEAALSRPIVKDLSDIVRPRIYGPDGNLAND